jgi:hypothetical protein
MLEEAGGRCFYCGNEAPEPEADHVIPIVRGGSSMLWNYVVACKKCNRLKSIATGWEFLPEPTDAQRERLVLVDRLTQRKRLGWWERRKLERAKKERLREGARRRSQIAFKTKMDTYNEARRQSHPEEYEKFRNW